MNDPLLAVTQPDTTSWGDAPHEKLVWLSMFYGIKPDLIVQHLTETAQQMWGVSRSSLYEVMAGNRPLNPKTRGKVAEIVGFPPEAWDWPLRQFDQWIVDNYPGFAGRFEPADNVA